MSSKRKLSVALVLTGIVFLLCLSWNLDTRERARADLERLLSSVAWEARGTVADLSEADLVFLDNYPQLTKLEIVGGDGSVLRSLVRNDNAGDWVGTREVPNSSGSVRMWANLPGWEPLTTAFPITTSALLLIFWGMTGLKRADPKSSPESPTESDVTAQPLVNGRALVMELDKELHIRAVGSGVTQFGYRKDELLGRHVADFVGHFEAQDGHEGGTLTDAAGRQVDSTIVSTSIRNQNGQVDRVVVSLTEECLDLQELRVRFHHLRRHYEVICENAIEQFFVVSQSLKVVYANRSLRTLLGRTEEEMVAAEFLDLLAPEQRLEVSDTVHEVLSGESTREAILTLEVNGEKRTLEGSFHFLNDEHSGTIMGVFRDITDRLRTQEELRISRERTLQAQREEALGRLAGGVAHDFNNLLACMIINLEFMECAVDKPEESECLADIRAAADKACSLVNQLLLYSRKQCAQTLDVCCNQVIEEVVKLTRPILKGRVSLTTQLSATHSVVSLEPGQLDQIVMNLIINARDAMPEGGRVVVKTRDVSDNMLEVTVKDDGHGVPKDIQSRIFEPYFTTKGIGEGTGLGLATVSAVIEKAGGIIRLESEEGHGAEFIIRLPAKRKNEHKPDSPHDSERLPADNESGGEGQFRVLLVEDMSGVQRLVSRLLRREGYQVTTAHDGYQAQKLLQAEHQFDLLVTDLNLPGLSGLEIAKLFTREELSRPVLLMSGYPGNTLDEDIALKNFAFVGKPFAADELSRAVASLRASEAVAP